VINFFQSREKIVKIEIARFFPNYND